MIVYFARRALARQLLCQYTSQPKTALDETLVRAARALLAMYRAHPPLFRPANSIAIMEAIALLDPPELERAP